MRLHLLTVGEPKLAYAREGWMLYLKRLQRYHTVRVTHIPDKYAYDAAYLRKRAGEAYIVALAIDANQMNTPELAAFLEARALESKEVCCMVGGPDGLPEEIIAAANLHWSLSRLTFPHDLAMVVLAESLYRASSFNAGQPYHH